MFTAVGLIVLLVGATFTIPLLVLCWQFRAGMQELLGSSSSGPRSPLARLAGPSRVLAPSSGSSPGLTSPAVSVSPSIVHSRFVEASALQRMLPHLVAVELAARQARWNVYGPEATTTRDILASVVADMANLTERVAGRLIELGFTPDARPTEVVATAVHTRAGRLSQDENATTMIDALSAAASPAFDAVVALESSGSASHEISSAALSVLRSYAARFASQQPARRLASRGPAETRELNHRSDCA